MGVALFIIPLVIAVFLAPFIYFLISYLFIKKVNAEEKKKKFPFLTASLLIIFSIYPASLLNEFKKFSDSCNIEQSDYPITKVQSIDGIVLAYEDAFDIPQVVLHLRDLASELNLKNYEYGAIRNGDFILKQSCTTYKNKCTDTHIFKNRYIFYVSSPKLNSNDVLQSDIKIIDNDTGLTLFKASEYILGGIIGAYHGQFISKESHRGYLACGYLNNHIAPWRPRGGNNNLTAKYIKKDVEIITQYFPSLAN